VLLVDKSAGVTSHDAIARARRALGVRRIGHMGTLDPFATGLLVLLVGRVTRLASYLQGEPKVYDATIRFGRQTDTDDGTGREIAVAPLPDARTVEDALPTLTGTFEQMPPAFSAKQVDGVRAYDAARRGAALALKPSVVTVHGWSVRGWRATGELDVTVTCGGGTYIRALARDLGTLSGSAAHLSALRRTRSGPYSVDEAVPLDQLESGVELRSALEGLSELSAVAVTGDEKARIARGQPIVADARSGDRPDARRAVLVDENRQIVAIAERQASSWAPRVVLIDG
jgi:tRNA pseudouridine55 synthase